MAKSKIKYEYGIDEPCELTTENFNDYTVMLMRRNLETNRGYIYDGSKWIVSESMIYVHSVEDLYNVFSKLSGNSINDANAKVLADMTKKKFYKDILDDKK